MPPVNGHAGKAETNLKSGMRALEKGSAKDSLRVSKETLLMWVSWFSSFSLYNMGKFVLFKLFKLIGPLKMSHVISTYKQKWNKNCFSWNQETESLFVPQKNWPKKYALYTSKCINCSRGEVDKKEQIVRTDDFGQHALEEFSSSDF